MCPSIIKQEAAADGAFTVTADGLRLRLRVKPRAAADRVGEFAADPGGVCRLKVAVTAAPHDGRANEAIVKLLAREWRIPKTALSLVSGGGGRDKVIAINGDPHVLAAKIGIWSAGHGIAGADRP